jgi:hypothetical protein
MNSDGVPGSCVQLWETVESSHELERDDVKCSSLLQSEHTHTHTHRASLCGSELSKKSKINVEILAMYTRPGKKEVMLVKSLKLCSEFAVSSPEYTANIMT